MKKSICAMLTVALALFTGCDKPTPEQIKKTATAVGYAAGLVADETPIKDNARNAVVDILNEVRACVPEEGQSFADAWAPVIKAKVAELVAAGKIDAATGEIVTGTAIIAAKGIDYLFDIRFPQAKKYKELVAAGASGVIDGFLTAFKPVDAEARAKAKSFDYDKDAYKWLKKNCK